MDQERLRSASAYEARRIGEWNDRLSADTVPADEVVAPQPLHLYQPPVFLGSVVEPGLVAELCDLLVEMHGLNEGSVGWNTREAEVFLNLSGQSQDLTRRLQAWTHQYLLRRLDPCRVNPKDKGDPFLKFERLLGEYDQIFGRLSGRPNSLNYLFLEASGLYAAWLVFQKTWRDHVIVMDGKIGLTYRPSAPAILTRCGQYLRQFHWLDKAIDTFAEGCAESGADASGLEGQSPEALRERLATLVEDIQEMRPFLVRNFRTEKSAVPLGEQLLHWQWSTRFGIGWALLATRQRDVFEFAQAGRAHHIATVDFDGLLRDIHLPWMGLPDRIGQSQVPSLPLNVLVLELMRDRLFEFYDRIDLGRLQPAAPGDDWNVESAERALAVSCQALARSESDVEPDTDAKAADAGRATAGGGLPRQVGRLRPLRQRQLLNLLERRFGCEVRRGKGSEISVFRKGAKKFILGGHRRNPAVPSHLIKLLLQRLGIAPPEWFAGVG